MTNEEQFKRFNNFKNSEKLEELLSQYKNIILAKQGILNIQSYTAIIEKYFNAKVSCGTCPASLKKAQSDFERIIFTRIYREFPYMLCKPDKNKLQNTRFINGMYETITTSSFSIFADLLSSFERDFVGRRLKIDRESYITAYNELIDFNTKRFRYFDELTSNGEPTLYSDYIRFKALYELIDTIVPEVKETTLEPVLNEELDLSRLEIKPERIKSEGKYETMRKVNLEEALKMKKEGMNNVQIAEHFGVTKQAIGKLFKTNIV